MSPDVDPEQVLVGRPGAARILGVSRQRVTALEGSRGFPKPLGVVVGEGNRYRQPIWRRTVMERYKVKRDAEAAAGAS